MDSGVPKGVNCMACLGHPQANNPHLRDGYMLVLGGISHQAACTTRSGATLWQALCAFDADGKLKIG